jgi:hypothetical protein
LWGVVINGYNSDVRERAKHITNTCQQCGQDFHPTSRGALGRATRFCSHACMWAARKGANNPAYKGGYVARGYRRISVDGKMVLEHRHVMEGVLGRPLLPGEIVHHRDGDGLNNAPDNLELLRSQSEHVQEHGTFRSETHKQCAKCGAVKPRTEFWRRRPDGHHADPNIPRCMACERERDMQRRPWRYPKDDRFARARHRPETPPAKTSQIDA